MRFEEILVFLTVLTGIICLVNLVYQKSCAKKHSNNHQKDNWAVEYSKSFFPVLLIVLILRSFVYEPFRIPSGSMKPTLLVGDFILVNKYVYGVRLPVLGTQLIKVGKPHTGDIVVFRHTEGMDLIKRVVGVPGDHIRYVNKQLYINDQPVLVDNTHPATDGYIPVESSTEHLGNIAHKIYITPEQREYYPYAEVIVPANSYFVMGDNRGNSKDSRSWGFVREADLLGKAVAIWMSWDSNGKGLKHIRWQRMGKSIYAIN